MRATTHCECDRRNSRLFWRCSCVVIAACLVCAEFRLACSDESPATVTTNSSTASGKVGEEVPSFYVRTVTGPLAGKSVCYVCRHGDRPVVMVLLRELGPE